MDYKQFVLDNGMRVVYCPTNDKGMIMAHAIIDAGSLYEDKLCVPKGTSHFVEHIAGNSLNKYIDFLEDYIEVAGWLGTHLGTNQTEIQFLNTSIMLKEDLGTFLKALKGILTPDFKEKVIEDERKRIIMEFHEQEEQFNGSYNVDLAKLLIGEDHPATDLHRVLGTPESINSITEKELKTFAATYLTPNKVTIYVSGDIPPNIEELACALFSDLSRGPQTDRINLQKSEKMVTGRYEEHDPNAELATITLYFPAPMGNEPGALEANILTSVLHDEIFNGLSRDNGLAYSAGTITKFIGKNRFCAISAQIKPENIEKAYEIIWTTIDGIREGNMPKNLLRKLTHSCKVTVVNDELNRIKSKIESFITKDRLGICLDERMDSLLKMTEKDVITAAKEQLPKREGGKYLEYVILPEKEEAEKEI